MHRGFFVKFIQLNIQKFMSTASKPLIFYPSIVTAILLSIPLIGGMVSAEVNWSLSDFVIGGLLIFVVSTVEVMLWRTLPKKRRWPVMLLLLALFVVLWAEMAVGIFGSPIAGS